MRVSPFFPTAAAFLFLASLASGQNSAPAHDAKQSSDVIYVSHNAKYQLTLQFHGWIHHAANRRINEYEPSYLTLTDDHTGLTAKQSLPGGHPLLIKSLIKAGMWSPDSEWLVLPESESLLGFQILQARTALEELKKHSPKEFLHLVSGKPLSISFHGWDSPDQLKLTVFHEGEDALYTFSLNGQTQRLESNDHVANGSGLVDEYETSKGRKATQGSMGR